MGAHNIRNKLLEMPLPRTCYFCFPLLFTVWSSSRLLVCAEDFEDDMVKLHGEFMSEAQLKRFRQKLRTAGDWRRHLQQHHPSIMTTIDALFDNRNEIDRVVETTAIGVVATTTSTNQDVVSLIQTHVNDMENLQFPIRQGDPLFAALFENIEQTNLAVEYILDSGVRVEHTGTTDCGVELVKDHAAQVSRFVDTGVRRPNFDWIEPDVCDNPQLINNPSSIVTVPPNTVSPTSTTIMPGDEPVSPTNRGTIEPTTTPVNPTQLSSSDKGNSDETSWSCGTTVRVAWLLMSLLVML